MSTINWNFLKKLIIKLVVLILILNINGCETKPSTSGATSLRQVALQRIADTSRVGNLSRHHVGDIFDVFGKSKCISTDEV